MPLCLTQFNIAGLAMGKKIICKLWASYKCALNKRVLYDIMVDVVTSETMCFAGVQRHKGANTTKATHKLNCISIVLRLDMGPGEGL